MKTNRKIPFTGEWSLFTQALKGDTTPLFKYLGHMGLNILALCEGSADRANKLLAHVVASYKKTGHGECILIGALEGDTECISIVEEWAK